MNKIFIILISILYASTSNAKDVSSFIGNLIPGEGLTEASIQINEDDNPDIEILAVRDLNSSEYSNTFTQFSLHTQETNGHDRIIGNLGFGYRKLSDDKSNLFGINAFIDNDFSATNRRASIGFELRNAVLDFHSNIYQGLKDSEDERVLDGWDYRLASQVPYLHWSKVFINHYEWDGVLRDDIKGTKMGSEIILTKSLNLEVAYDDKDKKGLEDEWYAKIQLVHPPRNNGPTAMDGVSQVAWKENKDMSGELLSKVQRNNKIMIECKGSSTISRTD